MTQLAHFPLMIPGATSKAPDKEVRAPFDNAPIATVAAADLGAVQKALETAHALFRDRDRWLTPAKRIEILSKATKIMQGRFEELAVSAKGMSPTAATELHTLIAYETGDLSALSTLAQSTDGSFATTLRRALAGPQLVTSEELDKIKERIIEKRTATQQCSYVELIATKAQIGSKREATAMAKVAIANKEVARLKDRLGFSVRQATILQVEDATGNDYDFLPLRRWCNAHEVVAESVPDKRYPKGVKAWPAAAWEACYGVDLNSLFTEGAV
jgi:hypothetical protein